MLHNYWFEKYKIDANYSILDIKEIELKNVIEKIKQELNGINITPINKIVSYIDVLINVH